MNVCPYCEAKIIWFGFGAEGIGFKCTDCGVKWKEINTNEDDNSTLFVLS